MVVVFKLTLGIGSLKNSDKVVLIWITLDFFDDKSTLVEVMAWCLMAPSHYLNRCWSSSIMPYDVIIGQWVNPLNILRKPLFIIYRFLCFRQQKQIYLLILVGNEMQTGDSAKNNITDLVLNEVWFGLLSMLTLSADRDECLKQRNILTKCRVKLVTSGCVKIINSIIMLSQTCFKVEYCWLMSFLNIIKFHLEFICLGMHVLVRLNHLQITWWLVAYMALSHYLNQ